jgi:hypothetical protein
MTWWAVCNGSPQVQWCGSFEAGLNRALYSPVKVCVVSKHIPVEKTSPECVASPWMKGEGVCHPGGGGGEC